MSLKSSIIATPPSRPARPRCAGIGCALLSRLAFFAFLLIQNYGHELGNATRAAAPAAQSPDHRFGDFPIRGVLRIEQMFGALVLELLVLFEQRHMRLLELLIGRWSGLFRLGEDRTMAQDRIGRCPVGLLHR